MENLHSKSGNFTDVPIVRKLIDIYKLFYAYSKLFPKNEKYTLGSKCEEYILSTLELILAATSASREQKLLFLKQANVKFDSLKIFLRLANELKVLDNKKYLELQKHIQE